MNRGKMNFHKCKCWVCAEKKIFYDAGQKYTLIPLNRMPKKLDCTQRQWWEILARYKGPVFYKRQWLSWVSIIKSYYPLELVKYAIETKFEEPAYFLTTEEEEKYYEVYPDKKRGK